MSAAPVDYVWFLFGYSLSFSRSGSASIGDLAHITLKNILNESPINKTTIPTIAYYLFHLMFIAAATTALTGAVSERARMWPTTIFTFIWCTLVYNFVSHWIWSQNGWARSLGSLDYAGGVPIHIQVATSSLAYSLLLGKRHATTNNTSIHKPHNINNVFMRTILIWFGWFGFSMEFCMGSTVGLVCIRPGSGYASIPASLVFGIFGSTFVYFGRTITTILHIDDPFDIFAQHVIGGSVGCILRGIFAQKYIPELDEITFCGGWIDGCWKQATHQLVFASAGFA
ncbi:unnamed protein product [Rotaria magnacalcarata]